MDMFAIDRPINANPDYCWEDVIVGESLRSGDVVVTEDDILQFAMAFDPLPIHIDREAANRSKFGGLTGSGSHMFAIRQRLLYDLEFPGAVIASLGVDKVKYHLPLRPGHRCSVAVKFSEKRPSQSNPGQGIVSLMTELIANDEVILSLIETVLMRRKQV
jgi:acyl dehydratase